VSGRAPSRLAWTLWMFSAGCVVAGVILRFLNSSTPTVGERNSLVFDAGFFLLFVAFATVGALVASRRPRNPIGWIFCVMGLSTPLAAASEEYALYALVAREGALPGGEATAWIAALAGGPVMFSMLAFVFLLFPGGRLLSRRWRPVVWLNFLAIALGLAWNFSPGPIENLGLLVVENPLGVAGVGVFLEPLGAVGFLLALAAVIAGAASLIVRLRRSRGEERQQLKWFVFAGALFCAVSATGPILWSLPPSPATAWVWPLLFLLAVGAIALAAGIAILKHNLYDIDLIINRTLVYASLTASLALVYLGSVIGLQFFFRTMTGGDSQLAVVASTLVIAALFNPLRRRIQNFIDRRFYREKYDAAKTLEAFSARARSETSLDALDETLISAVEDALRPSHASLWLRPPEKNR
jgi:hypothetical protein